VSESRLSQSDAELQSHVVRVLEPQYEVEKEIGRGGMGIVYKGRDTRLKRPVAIKLLPPELAFRSEIRSALPARGGDGGAAEPSAHRADLQRG
jgi:serine/threonine protein kinase